MAKKKISHTRAASSPKHALAFDTKRGTKCAPRGKPFARGNKIGHRFKPGESGNPSGRPKSKLISEALRWMLALEISEKIIPETRAEALADSLIRAGLRGKIGAVIECADRTEGKPAVTVGLGDKTDPLAQLILEMNRLHLEAGPPEEPSCPADDDTKETIQ